MLWSGAPSLAEQVSSGRGYVFATSTIQRLTQRPVHDRFVMSVKLEHVEPTVSVCTAVVKRSGLPGLKTSSLPAAEI